MGKTVSVLFQTEERIDGKIPADRSSLTVLLAGDPVHMALYLCEGMKDEA